MDAGSISYIVCEALIAVLTIIGNFLVLLAMYKNRRLQTTTNVFIGSLALADLLVGILVEPLAILSYKGLPRNFYGCVFVNSSLVLLTQCSVNGLVMVAIDRFVAIKMPYFYTKHFTPRFALFLTLIGWTVAIVVGMVPMMGWNRGPTEDGMCSFMGVIDLKYMVYFNFFGCIIPPVLFMSAVNAYIYTAILGQLKMMRSLESVGSNSNIAINCSWHLLRKDFQAAKSLVFIILLFIVCWFPIHISNCIVIFKGVAYQPHPSIMLVAILLSHANSFVNPILYAYGNSQFKYTIRGFFCKSNAVGSYPDWHTGSVVNQLSTGNRTNGFEERTLTRSGGIRHKETRMMQVASIT